MPDISSADLAAVAGTFVAAVITGLGLRRGEAEKRERPAADPSLPAGAFIGVDVETLRALLDELRDLHADLAAWRHEDEAVRRADRDRSTHARFEAIEDNQATILDLLRRREGR